MKANQIRVGSWLDFTGTEFRVDEWVSRDFLKYQKESKLSFHATLDNLKPIPLTEEWLLRFGYSITEFMGFEKGFSNGSKLHIQIMSGGVFTAFLEGDSVFVLICKLDFVHSLQNLYYSIEQKELCVDTLTRNT